MAVSMKHTQTAITDAGTAQPRFARPEERGICS
jgi:hypothetical protein